MPTAVVCNGCGSVTVTSPAPVDHPNILGQRCEACGYICDFCSSTPVTTSYPAVDTAVDLSGLHGSNGNWAACAICARLIDENDRDGLASRSVMTFIEEYLPEYPGPSAIADELRADFRVIHEAFFAARTGPGEAMAA